MGEVGLHGHGVFQIHVSCVLQDKFVGVSGTGGQKGIPVLAVDGDVPGAVFIGDPKNFNVGLGSPEGGFVGSLEAGICGKEPGQSREDLGHTHGSGCGVGGQGGSGDVGQAVALGQRDIMPCVGRRKDHQTGKQHTARQYHAQKQKQRGRKPSVILLTQKSVIVQADDLLLNKVRVGR